LIDLKEKLKNIPQKPGCYLFKDKQNVILYVGKARILRNRVRSYFQDSRSFHPKLAVLVQKIFDLEWIVTDSEVEALILENNLIKKHQPRYNIDLKDDKTYPYIRITNEDFPQVFITRKQVRDGSQYFGPYTNVKNVRYTLKTLIQIFPIRSCKHNLSPQVVRHKKVELCLDYYIKKCKGPCQGLQDKSEYDGMIEKVVRFLKGKTDDLVRDLKTEMQEFSEKMNFEEAARVRDRLLTLENYRNTQKVVQNDYKDRDLIALAKKDNDACAVLFRIRDGKIVGRVHYFISKVEWNESAEILNSFVEQYYFKTEDIPREIMLQYEIVEKNAIEKWLSERIDKKVKLINPRIGEKKKLLAMAEKNARYLLEDLKLQKLKAKDYTPHPVKALHRDLKLERLPRRMECFDISNIQGTDPVASMVCFVDGKPKKSEYRKFKIKVKETPDDFAMMREVIARRYSRLLREEKEFPDLVIVDGGKGQLSSAKKILDDLGLKNQPIIGLAKRLEEVFLPGFSDAQMLPKTSSSLKLLQQIRDEAHRFAITFHRERRRERTLKSELDQIPGVGPKRRAQLLQIFGSVKKIKNCTVDELQKTGKVSLSVAEKIFAQFHPLAE